MEQKAFFYVCTVLQADQNQGFWNMLSGVWVPSPCFPAIFTKGSHVCDFLFASLDWVASPKWYLDLKTSICSKKSKVDCHQELRRETNMTMGELPPEEMDPFILIFICTKQKTV